MIERAKKIEQNPPKTSLKRVFHYFSFFEPTQWSPTQKGFQDCLNNLSFFHRKHTQDNALHFDLSLMGSSRLMFTR